MAMTEEEFLRQLQGDSTNQPGLDNFMKALDVAASRPEKKLPSSIDMAERFLKGASAAGKRGMYGLKGALVGLTPEEKQQLAAEAEWVKHAGMPATLGGIASETAMLAPGLAFGGAGLMPAAQRAVSSGALSSLYEPGDIYQREKAGALGAIGSAVGEAIPYAVGTVTRSLEPLFEGGRTNVIARALQRVTGENAPQIASQLERSQSGVPGVQYTASEAAPSSGGLAAMQRWAEQANPEAYFQRRAENVGARKMAMQDIAGTELEKEAALNARKFATEPLYESAMQQTVPVDESLRELFKRPSMRGALNEAKNIAAEMGEPIPADLEKAIMSGEIPADISGQGLHWIKIGLDAMRNNPAAPIGKEQQRALKGTIDAFEQWRGANIPEYAQAQEAFKELSKPISRQMVGQSLYEKLNPALSDFGPMTRERSESFARALRDADITTQQALGFKGAKFENVMKPQDIQLYSDIASDLTRQAESASAGRGIGSNTFQNLAMQNIAERSGFPGTMIGKMFHAPLIDTAYTRAEQAMQRELADALLNPKKTAQLLKKRPSALLRLLEADYAHAPSSVIGSAVGSSFNR